MRGLVSAVLVGMSANVVGLRLPAAGVVGHVTVHLSAIRPTQRGGALASDPGFIYYDAEAGVERTVGVWSMPETGFAVDVTWLPSGRPVWWFAAPGLDPDDPEPTHVGFCGVEVGLPWFRLECRVGPRGACLGADGLCGFESFDDGVGVTWRDAGGPRLSAAVLPCVVAEPTGVVVFVTPVEGAVWSVRNAP